MLVTRQAKPHNPRGWLADGAGAVRDRGAGPLWVLSKVPRFSEAPFARGRALPQPSPRRAPAARSWRFHNDSGLVRLRAAQPGLYDYREGWGSSTHRNRRPSPSPPR